MNVSGNGEMSEDGVSGDEDMNDWGEWILI